MTKSNESTATEAGPKTGLALSVQQPWAWLIVNGYKGIENRDWPTRVRGWIGIHAGKKIDRDGEEFVRRAFPHIALPSEYDIGGIVGRARLVGCVHERDAHLLAERDQPWFFGVHGFVLDSAEPLPFIPCRGMLGFFKPALPAQSVESSHV